MTSGQISSGLDLTYASSTITTQKPTERELDLLFEAMYDDYIGDGDMCMYALTVSTMEPRNVKEAMTDPAWIESMQEELLQFKRLDVWVLVPAPDNIKPLTLKWLIKNKHDEENIVIQNKTRLVIMLPKRTTTPMTDATIKQLIAQGIADALAEYEANRSSGNGNDSHDSGSSIRRTEHTTRECTYSDILKCQPLNFKGTKGVVGMDVVSYTQRFQELALMCERMFPKESDQVENYVEGLSDMIQGSVMASKQKIMLEEIKIVNDLMDKKVCAYAERQAENKRKLDNNNQAQQQPPKKQNMARAYSSGPCEKKKKYARTLPLCNKCKFHHNGSCTNHGNQAGGTKACGMVYAFGGGETDQDLDNMEDDINA
nr:reverse transcriptase domain-containing protein [Tanacetum cinerariifolium]